MNGCYIGRGSLLVSVLGASRGFFTLSAESELTLELEEDNESIFDARNGANERIEWYVRNRRARLLADCYRIEPNAIELLLKAKQTVYGAGASAIVLPLVEVSRGYPINPNTVPATVVVTDSLAAVVPATKYEISDAYGLITFNDIGGYTQPFTVTANWTGYTSLAIHDKTQIDVAARFHGVNKVTGQKVMAQFYRLAVDISEQLVLIKKEFSPLSVRLQAIPDVTQPLDASLGQYGRIILL